MDIVIYSTDDDEVEEVSVEESSDFNESEFAERDKELTNKYLAGELSFTDYAKQWSCKNSREAINTATTSQEIKPPTRHKKSITRRPKTHLSPTLLCLMGEANIRFVRGDREMAEKICGEVIREVPLASEPYALLSQIYESNSDKSMQFLLLSAHLNPSNEELWLHLAALSKKKGDIKQEILCLTKAIDANKTNLDYHLKRINAIKEYEASGNHTVVTQLSLSKCFLRLIRLASPVEPTFVLQLAKEAAAMYYKENDYDNALLAMSTAYEKCFNLFTNEDVNLYLDLLIIKEKFSVCLNVFVAKCDVEIEADIQTISENGCIREYTHIISCIIPDSLPVDISTKLLVCLIHLGSPSIAEMLLSKLLANDVESSGDLYLDVEEAFTAQRQYEKALSLLEPLVKSQRFSLPAVWLKHAECLNALGRIEDAIKSFKTVVIMAPQHIGARIKLYEFFMSKGLTRDAIKALEQDEATTLLDTGLLYKRCEILKSLKCYHEYLKVGQLLLYRHFPRLRSKEEIQTLRVRDDCLHATRIARGENPEDENAPSFDVDAHKLILQEEWDLFIDLYMTAKKLKKYAYMVRLCFEALGSKLFSKNRAEIDFMALIACIHHEEFYYAYNLVREMFWQQANRDKVRFYNLFNIVIHGCEDTRYQKLVLRLNNRHECTPLTLLRCNNFITSGLFREALPNLLIEYKKNPSPELAFMVGICMLFRACQNFIQKNKKFIIQAMSFLSHYKVIRGPDAAQETNYNLGRAYHMLGVYNLAIFHYQKVLETDHVQCIDHVDCLSLKYEAAYNLHCIYKNSSPLMALMYLEKYIVI